MGRGERALPFIWLLEKACTTVQLLWLILLLTKSRLASLHINVVLEFSILLALSISLMWGEVLPPAGTACTTVLVYVCTAYVFILAGQSTDVQCASVHNPCRPEAYVLLNLNREMPHFMQPKPPSPAMFKGHVLPRYLYLSDRANLKRASAKVCGLSALLEASGLVNYLIQCEKFCRHLCFKQHRTFLVVPLLYTDRLSCLRVFRRNLFSLSFFDVSRSR